MGILFKRYKTKFRYALKPFFVLLNAKRKELHEKEWKIFVFQLRQNIITNPAEFLGDDLPDTNLMADILDEIFLEFQQERAYHDRVNQNMG